MKIKTGVAYSFYQIGQRGNQEDARYPNRDEIEAGWRYYAVCDGVGGNEKGEVASGTVCESIGQWAQAQGGDEGFEKKEMESMLAKCYDDLYAAATENNKDMATTLTFVTVHDRGVTAAHIGDSRIYHIRPGVGVMYRSDDHSLVNSLVHAGCLSPEEAIDHPRSNVITRCMTADRGEEPSAATVMEIEDVEKGDYFLLCSDGVLHCIDDHELVRLLEGTEEDREKMRRLAERCKNSSDNNTAILVPIAKVDRGEVLDVDVLGQEMKEPENSQTIMMDTMKKTVDEVKVEKRDKQQEGDHKSGWKKIIGNLFNKR